MQGTSELAPLLFIPFLTSSSPFVCLFLHLEAHPYLPQYLLVA